MPGQSDRLPANYDDPETNGIVIPQNSPVNKGIKRRKKRTKGNFAKMEEHAIRYLTDAEFRVYAAMMYLGGWRGGCVVLTHEKIGEVIGKGRHAITRAQAGLIEKGFIERMPSPKMWGCLWKVNITWEDIRANTDADALFGSKSMLQKCDIDRGSMVQKCDTARDNPSDETKRSKAPLGWRSENQNLKAKSRKAIGS